MNIPRQLRIVYSSILLLGISLLINSSAMSGVFVYEFQEFGQIPILDQGRVKPIDTFARSQLESFYGREKLKDVSASEWLAELLFDPTRGYKRPVFNIANPKIVDALELERRKKHRYSYVEVYDAIQSHFDTWHSLFVTPQDQLTADQKQLLTLYNKVQHYGRISRSFSFLFNAFYISDEQIAKELGLPFNKDINYLQIRPKQNQIFEMATKAAEKKTTKETITAQDLFIVSLANRISEVESDQTNQVLRVIPPQWKTDDQSVWFSPWSISFVGLSSPQSAEFLKQWELLYRAYQRADNDQWVEASKQVRASSIKMAENEISQKLLSSEFKFNHLKPFTKSLMFYLCAFLLLLTGFLFWPKWMSRISFLLILIGFVLHTGGLLTRMIVMKRPPVTNLYGSIIFVAFIVVLFGIILELRRKNNVGLLIASSMGTMLHFLGLKYDADGDTMGMLQAVLDTNFWLATHVVTITIGYGCCLVGGVLAHIYLIQRIAKPQNVKQSKELFANMKGVAIVALFFTAVGTILGGIWADQSWGRFWGWDPKENGALLIVLWLVFLIHGRIAGKIKELGYAAGMVLTNAIVAIAWFGVNLLSVGLHSYGFTENAALNLFLFCGFELVFALSCYAVLKNRLRKGLA